MLMVPVSHGKAAAIDGDTAGNHDMRGERRSVNSELATRRTYFEFGDSALMFDDAGKHGDETFPYDKIADL